MESLQSPTKVQKVERHSSSPTGAGAARTWSGERERLLLRLCLRLKARRSKGEQITRAAWRLARQWRGRFYRSRPTKPVEVSGSLLLRKYYELENAEWDPSVLRLRYRIPPHRTLPSRLAAEFARRCLATRSAPVAAVFRAMVADWERGVVLSGIPPATESKAAFPFTLSTFYRRVPGKAVRALRARRAALAQGLRSLNADESQLRLSGGNHEN